MDDNNAKKVKRTDGVVWRVVDGEAVILIPEEAALHALTGCGSRIWDLIEEEIAVPEIVQRICNEYDVDQQRAEREITEYVHKLEGLKLVEIVSVATKEATV